MASVIPVNLGIVTIRHLTEHDHLAYVALERDPLVKQYVDGPNLRTDEDLLFNLRAYKPTTALLTVAETATDAFIGRCGLLSKSNGEELEVYCLLAKSHWNRGIGQCVIPFLAELASQQSKVAIGIVDPSNSRSLALLKKLEWVFTGVISVPGKQQGHHLYAARRA